MFACPVFTQGFDPDSSYIEFKASNWWVNTVSGTIKGWEGTVAWDAENPRQSEFDITAKVKTIDTDNEERDEHLRSADFFHVEQYPLVRFESIRINDLPDAGYIAVGNLTIKDVTQEVLLPFEVKSGKLVGEMTINRLEYNLGEDESTFSIGKEITVEIVCDLQ